MRAIWRKNEDGTALMEFAILAPIFFALIMVIFDLAIFVATRTIVEDAVENASRAIRLGILTQEDGEEAFREVLCSRLIFLKCSRIDFTVAAPAGGLSTDYNPPLDQNGAFTEREYNPGSSEDFVIVTVVYRHDFIFPYVGDLFGDKGLLNHRSRLIEAFLVFKNEPYPTDDENG